MRLEIMLAASLVLSFIVNAPECKSMDAEWNPREAALNALVSSVPATLASQDKTTGRFGKKPWICTDQNVVFPLAAAWAINDPKNPHCRNAELLEAVMKGGDALIADQDDKGMWTFRKKDNSTWGQILMPWTYSRWIRAFHLIKDAMPEDRRRHWEKGLRLGFENISKSCLGHVHNIPAHHAMALYCAGICFDREDWKTQAGKFMARVVAAQSPGGWWSEHSGPVVAYNFVYCEALGLYYAMSNDESVLEALRRAAAYHAAFTYPDGSSVETVDERNAYHAGVSVGNVGFSFTPEGRGYLLHQHTLKNWSMAADHAASFLLYGATGKVAPIPADAGDNLAVIGKNEALILQKKPWFVCLSAFVCEPPLNRWQQDRQNFVSVFHDRLGLVVGGGNTKLQPFWSNFTVGDTSLLQHTPGDDNPDFKPKGDLIHVPSAATLRPDKAAPGLDLKYGTEDCRITVLPRDDQSLAIIYESTCRSGRAVEGHIVFLPRLNAAIKCESGKTTKMSSEQIEWPASEMGGWFEWTGWRVSVPAGARLSWPRKAHNPYKKDGSSTLAEARMVLCLPFSAAAPKHEVTLTIAK